MSKMTVCYCSDENALPLLKMSAETVLKFNPDAEITVISQHPLDVPYKNILLDTEGYYLRRKFSDRVTKETYFKLFLPTLGFDRCLYLDCDTLCAGDLSPLWEMDIPYIGICHSHNAGMKQAIQVGVPQYGSAGMLFLNCPELQKIHFTQTMFRVLPNLHINGTFRHDETLLNAVYNDLFTWLPVKWCKCKNRCYSAYKDEVPFNKSIIRHYIGGQKSAQERDFTSIMSNVVPIPQAPQKKKRVLIFSNMKYPVERKVETKNDDILVFLNKATTAEYYRDDVVEKKILIRARSLESAFGSEISWCENLTTLEGNDIPEEFLSELHAGYDWNYYSEHSKWRGPTTGYIAAFYMAKQYPDREIILVNFGYNVSKSTKRNDDHNWIFENEKLKAFSHIYTADTIEGPKKILLVTGTNQEDDAIAERLVHDLAAIGVRVNVRSRRHSTIWKNNADVDRTITAGTCDCCFQFRYKENEKISREEKYRDQCSKAIGVNLMSKKCDNIAKSLSKIQKRIKMRRKG